MRPTYKWLETHNVWTGEPMYDSNHYDEIPRGWQIAFGKQMVEELNTMLIKYNFAEEYKILQIKEKFGQLRWYDGGIPIEMLEEYDDWLDKYTALSEATCIVCGEPATHMTRGWVLPMCDDHGNEERRK